MNSCDINGNVDSYRVGQQQAHDRLAWRTTSTINLKSGQLPWHSTQGFDDSRFRFLELFNSLTSRAAAICCSSCQGLWKVKVDYRWQLSAKVSKWRSSCPRGQRIGEELISFIKNKLPIQHVFLEIEKLWRKLHDNWSLRRHPAADSIPKSKRQSWS